MCNKFKGGGVTDANGEYATRGYYGDYDITVSAHGKTKTVSAPCYKGNNNAQTIYTTIGFDYAVRKWRCRLKSCVPRGGIT